MGEDFPLKSATPKKERCSFSRGHCEWLSPLCDRSNPLNLSNKDCFVATDPKAEVLGGKDQPRMDQLITAALQRFPVKAILLECTNLPPYKHILRRHFAGEIVDCLTVLEAASPGLVKDCYL